MVSVSSDLHSVSSSRPWVWCCGGGSRWRRASCRFRSVGGRLQHSLCHQTFPHPLTHSGRTGLEMFSCVSHYYYLVRINNMCLLYRHILQQQNNLSSGCMLVFTNRGLLIFNLGMISLFLKGQWIISRLECIRIMRFAQEDWMRISHVERLRAVQGFSVQEV